MPLFPKSSLRLFSTLFAFENVGQSTSSSLLSKHSLLNVVSYTPMVICNSVYPNESIGSVDVKI